MVTKKRKEDAGNSRGYARTDLACEAVDFEGRTEEEILRLGGGEPVKLARHWAKDGGRYVTMFCGRLTTRGEGELDDMADVLADELVHMTTEVVGRAPDPALRVLVVGLGNAAMTADAIGPGTVQRMTVTRHLRVYEGEMYGALGCCELSAVTPGVLGATGMETVEVVMGAVSHVRPDLVIAVDALAARSPDRLAATVQLSNVGIAPGSGVGNHRRALNKGSLGCPVLALGMPTVVTSSTLVYDALGQAGMSDEDITPALRQVLDNGRSFVVSPRDSDRITELTCMLLSRALDRAFGIEGL